MLIWLRLMSLAVLGRQSAAIFGVAQWKGPNSGAERRGLGDIPGKQHIDGVDSMSPMQVRMSRKYGRAKPKRNPCPH